LSTGKTLHWQRHTETKREWIEKDVLKSKTEAILIFGKSRFQPKIRRDKEGHFQHINKRTSIKKINMHQT
jgi:hypothetical protein